MTDTQMSLPELEAQRAELDAKIAAAKLAAKADAIARVLALMDELGVTRRMLGGGGSGPIKPPAARRHPSAGNKVAVKYANGLGDTWSGRGLQPKWLREAIAGGAALESFKVA